ncbi:MAG: hypothetical protein CSA20_04140 [Deltaproteobacteria bacterium]|nr:MAG: hypothetical protein CSA20_04140 [Deltaproteobacteria bacterium]
MWLSSSKQTPPPQAAGGGVGPQLHNKTVHIMALLYFFLSLNMIPFSSNRPTGREVFTCFT